MRSGWPHVDEPQESGAHGVGRVLIAVYAVFAVAATARAAVQISSKFDEAPVAYSLSAVAALVYVVATSRWRGRVGWRTGLPSSPARPSWSGCS